MDNLQADVTEKFPFKCILDVGLTRTTCGNKVFGVMKGALDAGIHIPHSTKKYPGNDKKGEKYDAAVHRERIFGVHVDK